MSLLAACAGAQLRDGRFENERVRYALEEPGAGWAMLRVPGANAAWRHETLSAALLVNSHCEGVDDAPLDVLTRHLVMGWSDVTLGEAQPRTVAGRAALETMAEASLDGIPRRLRLLVVKKDGCVYDVVLDARPETFDAALPAFERLRDSLAIDRRKDWR